MSIKVIRATDFNIRFNDLTAEGEVLILTRLVLSAAPLNPDSGWNSSLNCQSIQRSSGVEGS